MGVEPYGGLWRSVADCGGVWWSDEMKCDGWSHQPQKVTSTPKSHINPKKSKKSKNPPQKKKKLGPFCYKNVEKMFHQPQKVTLTPQKVKKVKKVKKIYFLFFTYCVRKSHIDTYILPHLKNPYYE